MNTQQAADGGPRSLMWIGQEDVIESAQKSVVGGSALHVRTDLIYRVNIFIYIKKKSIHYLYIHRVYLALIYLTLPSPCVQIRCVWTVHACMHCCADGKKRRQNTVNRAVCAPPSSHVRLSV